MKTGLPKFMFSLLMWMACGYLIGTTIAKVANYLMGAF